MSQRDILDVLIKTNTWMTTAQIRERVNMNDAAITVCLRRLEKGKFVQITRDFSKKNANMYKINNEQIEKLYD